MSVASNIWDSVSDTAKSLGGAAVAAPGAVWDLASSTWDGKDDNFGTYTAKVSKRAKDALDPLLNDETLTGYTFSKTMHALEAVYREGVSEPIATAGTVVGHVGYNPAENWDDIFSGRTWGEAYDIAQNRSLGQAYALTGLSVGRGLVGDEMNQQINEALPDWMPNGIVDPLDARAYEKLHEQNEMLTSAYSGTSDFAARWYLDPGVVLGKAAGAARAGAKHGKITRQDHLTGIRRSLDEQHKATFGVGPFRVPAQSLKTRTEHYFDWLEKGADGQRLNATQIWVGTPELRRSGAGRQVASLFEQAGKISDDAVRRDTYRNIYAVAAGDDTAIWTARKELAETARINDELKNIAKGSVVDLKATALGEHILASPELSAHLKRQLDNIPETQKAVQSHMKRLQTLVGGHADDAGVASSLDHALGVSAKGKRAVGRESGKGLLRDGQSNLGIGPVDKALTPVGRGLQTVMQASPSSVPLRVITTPAQLATRAAVGYARTPQKAMDALRTTRLMGMANLHDWNGATSQLDSMMRGSFVAPERRMELLSEGFRARTEAEKMRLIERVEKESIGSMANHFSAKLGEKVDQDFIEALLSKGNAKRASFMAPRQGRAYAATKDERYLDPMTGRNADRVEDALESYQRRVDQIMLDENGVPNLLAQPVLETQLANKVPLVDTELAKQMLEREAGTIARKAKAWSHLKYEADRLSRAKAAVGSGTQKVLGTGKRPGTDDQIRGLYDAMDMLVDTAAHSVRVWKFSKLFRLGYPLRIVMDDHMRIWSQIGAASVFAPLRDEFVQNFKYNQGTRRALVARERAELRAEREELLDSLVPENEAAWADRDEQIRKLNRRIAALRGGATRAEGRLPDKAGELSTKADELTAERDALQAAQGPNPSATKSRIAEIERRLNVSAKDMRKETRKRRVGEKAIVMQDGTVYHGAFGGDLGDASRVASSSNDTWDNNLKVGEERSYGDMVNDGNWGVVSPGVNPSEHRQHLVTWADTINNQFRQSSVAMHFINGGDTQTFTRWLKEPEQAQLRERLAHYAHDPEDWAERTQQLISDYIDRTPGLREAVASGRVTPNQLNKLHPEVTTRPTVHGATVSHNLGLSQAATKVGRAMNRTMKLLGEMPTDRLSRHPYFAAVYNSEVTELHLRQMAAAKREGRTHLTAEDIRKTEAAARRNALADLKRTLFDIEAHSNAAHTMRFVSPFFAAHQESIQRWWRIVSENPEVIRRFQQFFDVPKKLNLVIDEDGEPVKDGTMVGPGQYVLMQWPEDWGGPVIDPSDPEFKGYSDWRFSLNSVNLVLQSGSPLNPGVGPAVSLPAEKLVDSYVKEEEIEQFARLLNPYPPGSVIEEMLPSWVNRVAQAMRGKDSYHYTRIFNDNVQDKVVAFREANGYREPTPAEKAGIMEAAKRETQAEAWIRVAQNAFSPFPASPNSKYDVIRQGYQRLWDQANTQGKDYDWVMKQFKAKYGDVYLPLLQSSSNNQANMPLTNEAAGAHQRHKKLLNKIDPRLHGAIVAPEAGDESDMSMGAVNYFRRTETFTGSGETYLDYDSPDAAFVEGAVKRGWSRYGDVMDALQAMAVDQGLGSWRESDELSLMRDRAVLALKEENNYWGEDFESFGTESFNAVIGDLEMVVKDRTLSGDVARQDVRAVAQYLQLRKMFEQALEIRAANGGASTMEAQANRDLAVAYQRAFGILEESNTYFQRYWVNGVLDRDPFLVDLEEQ